MYKYSKKTLPLLNVVPMCSDEVPGQRLPWNVLGYGVNSGLDVHQPPLIGVQSVLQVPARSGGVWDSPYQGWVNHVYYFLYDSVWHIRTWPLTLGVSVDFTCWAARSSWCRTELHWDVFSLRFRWSSETCSRQTPTPSSHQQPQLGSRWQIVGWDGSWITHSCFPTSGLLCFETFFVAGLLTLLSL